MEKWFGFLVTAIGLLLYAMGLMLFFLAITGRESESAEVPPEGVKEIRKFRERFSFGLIGWGGALTAAGIKFF